MICKSPKSLHVSRTILRFLVWQEWDRVFMSFKVQFSSSGLISIMGLVKSSFEPRRTYSASTFPGCEELTHTWRPHSPPQPFGCSLSPTFQFTPILVPNTWHLGIKTILLGWKGKLLETSVLHTWEQPHREKKNLVSICTLARGRASPRTHIFQFPIHLEPPSVVF